MRRLPRGVVPGPAGGLDAGAVLQRLGHVGRTDLLGARDNIAMIDATELCPVMDVNGNTAKLMACFLLRIAAVAARKRGSRVDPSIKRERLRAG